MGGGRVMCWTRCCGKTTTLSSCFCTSIAYSHWVANGFHCVEPDIGRIQVVEEGHDEQSQETPDNTGNLNADDVKPHLVIIARLS